MAEVFSGYITDNVKITKVSDHTTAGTTDVTSSSVDMAGWDGVMFLTSLGTAAAGNIVTLHGSPDDSSFTATTALKSSGTSDEDVAVDLQSPVSRYYKAVVTRGTSSTCESIWAVQYRGRSKAQSFAVSGTSCVGQFAGV
jgi:hypothetical protein